MTRHNIALAVGRVKAAPLKRPLATHHITSVEENRKNGQIRYVHNKTLRYDS